jgi:hypothetical protein
MSARSKSAPRIGEGYDNQRPPTVRGWKADRARRRAAEHGPDQIAEPTRMLGGKAGDIGVDAQGSVFLRQRLRGGIGEQNPGRSVEEDHWGESTRQLRS